MSNSLTKRPAGGFDLQPRDMDQAMRLADMLATSGMVPKQYINNPQGTLVAMMMGNEIGLNPLQALQNIAVINGKPSIYADALLALVQNHPKFGGHEESFNEQTMTATCTVWRKGDEKKHTVTFSQADAVQAGLWDKVGPWKQYPKRMLMWRARGFALRDKFADALGGLITVEEARDIPEHDMGPAKRYEPPKEQEAQSLPAYPQERLTKKLPDFKTNIEDGTAAQDIVDFLESKYTLTDEQRQQILGLEAGAEA